MEAMELPSEFKKKLDRNRELMSNAIRNHQNVFTKYKEGKENMDLREELNAAQKAIVDIGLAQKELFKILRKEYLNYKRTIKTNALKNGCEERRANLSNAIAKAKKQNRSSGPSASPSDESPCSTAPPTPEQPAFNPVNPHDVSQNEFLFYLSLCTFDVFKKMQEKKTTRKRRATTNPAFIYNNKSDLSTKRKKALINQSISPPHTRQAQKKKAERITPPKKSSSPPSPTDLGIPNLPSGLIIERVDVKNSGERICVDCRLPGNLLYCDSCTNGFHLSCHHSSSQTSRQCPRCVSAKETRTIGSLTVPSGMSVSYVSAEISEKIKIRNSLLEKNKSLNAELSQLQEKHSQLTISLKTQQSQKQEQLETQQSTEEKIEKILNFISRVKNNLVQTES